jgi:hypothetical protein
MIDMAGVKSTRKLGYTLKGMLNLENMTISEVTEEEEIVHDLEAILEQFNDKEVSVSIAMTDKLERGVE